jgi:hypothetical protein
VCDGVEVVCTNHFPSSLSPSTLATQTRNECTEVARKISTLVKTCSMKHTMMMNQTGRVNVQGRLNVNVNVKEKENKNVWDCKDWILFEQTTYTLVRWKHPMQCDVHDAYTRPMKRLVPFVLMFDVQLMTDRSDDVCFLIHQPNCFPVCRV